MALIKCKECGASISSQAKACPQCGAKPPYRPGVGIIIFFIVVLGFGLKAISTDRAPPPTPTPEVPDSAARGACLIFIKRTLHDPGSAEFEGSDSVYSSQTGNVWTVQRPVRAKNAFNATRRSIFECKMRKDGDTWVPISVKQIKP